MNRSLNSTMRKSYQRIHSYMHKKLLLAGIITIACLVFMHSIYSSPSFISEEAVDKVELKTYLTNADVYDDVMKFTVPIKGIMENPVTLFVEQDNPWLINLIKKKYIEPPSSFPYNLEKILDSRDDDPSFWQAREIYKLYDEKKNGIFVDCGAHDGEFLSNTLSLEKLYGWTGALIEANPNSYDKLKTKHRKSWTVSSCLSPYPHPKKMQLKLADTLSLLSKKNFQEKEEGYSTVQCFPLYSILLALNLTKIDYFSLDVEGSELDILKTIPWEKVDITAWSVEFNHIRQGKSALKEYMKNQGYKVYIDGARMKVEQNVDIIFVKKSFLEKNLMEAK